jgi:hypothetical protein
MSVKARQRLERMIARRVVLDGIRAGYSLSVDNGGDEDEIVKSTKAKDILEAMFATDDEKLYFYKGDTCVGWVWFVYGNDGYDVVSDYTTNLEEVMKGADELAAKYG